MLCFRCGKLGHRAAECNAPTPRVKTGKPGTGLGTAWKTARKTLEKSRGAHQAEAETPTGTADKSRVRADGAPQLDSCDSNDDVENDPMVSMVVGTCI